MSAAAAGAGLPEPVVQKLGSGTFEITGNLNNLSDTQLVTTTNNIVAALAKVAKVSDNQVSTSNVGPTWGGVVTQRAVEALLIFFLAVAIYIAIRFEPKMAAAALLAMVHDLLVTVGVYSLFGFQITPDTVIAILTILGYSLYDTVVVFDRVRDNTNGVLKTGDLTYSDMVNLSMNQTLARSINTSLVAVLPVLSVLVVGAYILGATTLQNYGLALFVGLVAGAYSSIFIASPLLTLMKEREPRYRDLAQRVAQRSEKRQLTPAGAARLQANPHEASVSPIQARGRKPKRR
jgi:preprotein translocase subunit SecF